MQVNINEIQVGDIFSESPYYRVVKVNKNDVTFQHIQSNKEVTLSNNYVTELLTTADQYSSEVSVGILDKIWSAKQIEEAEKKGQIKKGEVQVGDLKLKGIKTLWAEVGSRVCSVQFEKKGKELSVTAFEKKVKEVTENALQQINQASAGRKGVAKTAAQILEEVIRNPITNYERGELRTMRLYKLQHESPDGFYQVVDLDITSGDNKRLVNLNTLKWLVVGGVKYVVE